LSPEAGAPAFAGLEFADRIVRWQRSHGRSSLPWQATRDPYRVWLSEVMLQQTQVSTVLGYFERFLARFPTVAALAGGTQDEVFGLWSGLGYYSRARNMHRCAQEVMARFDGAFPSTAAQLQTLPGIGRSTAAAIASFCFGERVAILDGNVKRVLTRVCGFDADLSVAANERRLWTLATALLPVKDLSRAMPSYTQGVMDLGATVCLPKRPNCLLCPVNDLCVARKQGDPERCPVKTRKLRRSAQALWMLRAEDAKGRVWLVKRPARGIWAGLYCLPVFEDRDALLGALPSRARVFDEAPFLHVLTHKDLHLHPVSFCGEPVSMSEGAWFDASAWPELGLPAPVRKLLLQAPSSSR
jgi:A/G-specific adenine glycosylase